MGDEASDRSSFSKQLDQAEDAATWIGLLVSGAVFAIGVGGLVFVISHVLSTTPPSWGSQGEWLYGGLGCLLLASLGFGQAAKFFARKVRARQDAETGPTANVHLGPDGFSFELNPTERPVVGHADTATWSKSFGATPVRALEVTEEQLSAADAAAQAGADWETVCRQVNPDYATWPEFERNVYRQAMQTSVENRRHRRAAT